MPKIYSLVYTALMVVDDHMTHEDMIRDTENYLAENPIPKHQHVIETVIQQQSDKAFCCNVCGSPLVHKTFLEGTTKAVLDIATGLPSQETVGFEGERKHHLECQKDTTHAIDEELVNFLKTALEEV